LGLYVEFLHTPFPERDRLAQINQSKVENDPKLGSEPENIIPNPNLN